MATNCIEVYVKHPSGRNAQYTMMPHQTMDYLSAQVANEEGIPEDHVRLKYQGKILKKNKSAQEYGVRVETILKAEILIPSTLNLEVKIQTDGEIATTADISISNVESLRELYQRVGEAAEVPSSELQLKIAGRSLPMSDDAILDAGISTDSKIEAVITEKVPAKSQSNQAKEEEKLSESELQTIISSFHTYGKRVEVVFSFDTTGSMYGYLTQVRTKLRESITRLLQEVPGIRIGLIAHGDYCDDTDYSYVLRQVDLTTDVNTLVDFADSVPATGGGDSPECYEWVLRKAHLLDWSEDSAKALVVIGDLYPHPPSYTDQGINWRSELDLLAGMGVKVYGVQAGQIQEVTKFYKELAYVSGGCYISLGHMDAITDMFLAVCFRESEDVNMLDNFVQEVEDAGEMTDVKRTMFTQLQQKKAASPDASTSSGAATSDSSPWWSIENDRGTPLYMYDAQNDKWEPDMRTNPMRTHKATAPASALTSIRRKLKTKASTKCVVM